MVEKGLIIKESISHDRRRMRVRLTENGVSALNRSMPIIHEFYSRLVDCVGEAKGKEIITILGRLNTLYKKEMIKLDKEARSKRLSINSA